MIGGLALTRENALILAAILVVAARTIAVCAASTSCCMPASSCSVSLFALVPVAVRRPNRRRGMALTTSQLGSNLSSEQPECRRNILARA